MKKLYIIPALLAMFFAANSSFAQGNMAIIDIEKVSKEAKVVKDITSKISKKRDQFQKEISAKEKTLEAEKTKIEAKKGVLSEEKLEKEQKDFISKVEDLKKFAEKRDATLKKAYTDAIKKVNEKVGDIVAKIAKEKELSVVFPSSQVIYALDNLEITEDVIKQLDKEISSISVKFE